MKQIVLTVGLGLAFVLAASSAFCAEVVGTITDLQGHPVSGVKIGAQNSAGKVVGQAIANANGHYAIGELSPNTYNYTLDPLATGFKGGSAVSYLDSSGLIVDWKVSNTNDATALARQGNKQVLAGDPFGLSMEEFTSVVVLGTAAIAAGVVGGYGAAGGFSSSPSGSPTPVGVPPTSSSM
jgi:hypothetical protein